MRIALVAPTAIPIPVREYGGIEREVEWLGEALVQLGHEVAIFGNVDRKQLDDVDWCGVPVASEESIFRHIEDLATYDIVHDWTHTKPLRLARLSKYVSTTMWTDQRSGHDMYPSRAVAEAFGDPKGRVVYLGLPTQGMAEPANPADGRPYLSFGRIAPYKGQDLAIKVARASGVPLVVAGHTGAFADAYFTLTIAKKCRDAGFRYLGDVPGDQVAQILGSSRGLLHLHRWIESFGLVVAHALCLGVPVLATEIGAPKELLAETRGGIAIKVPEETARWSPPPPDMAEYFASRWDRHAIAKRARELFDIGRAARAYTALYEEL